MDDADTTRLSQARPVGDWQRPHALVQEVALPSSGQEKGRPAAGFFQSLHGALCTGFCAALSRAMKVPFTARAAGGTVCDWEGFLGSIEENSFCFALGSRWAPSPAAQTDPTPGPPLWLEFTPQIAFPILDRMLGGTARDNCLANRSLTMVERHLLARVVNLAGRHLGECWPAPHPVFLCVPETPFCLQERADFIAARADAGSPHDPSVGVLKVSLQMAKHAGAIRLCIPLAALPQTARPHAPGPWQWEDTPPRPAASLLELSVAAPDVPVSQQELADLRCGDILLSDAAGDDEVIVRLAGIPKFYARLGTSNGRRAIRITRRISDKP